MALANRNEQGEPLAQTQLVLPAILSNGQAVDQFHDEIEPACRCRARVQHAGYIGVVHQRQSLPLGLEAGHHLLAVHAGFDDLKRHHTADRMLLFGAVYHSHSTARDLLENSVGADQAAGFDGIRFDLVDG